MKFERHYYKSEKYHVEYMTVQGVVYFDNEYAFCGHPWILLSASKGDDWHNPYTINITICDDDDCDIEVAYYPGEEKFIDVLRELINWMNDLEHGVYSWDKFVKNMDDFFPDCKRRKQ